MKRKLHLLIAIYIERLSMKKKRHLRKEIKDCLKLSLTGALIVSVMTLLMACNGIDISEAPQLGNEEFTKNMAMEEETEEESKDDIDISKETDLTIEERIKQACKKYDIDSDIPLAISILETGWWSSDAYIYGNNPGGMSINEVPIIYDSIDDGVDAFVSNLAYNYFRIGLDTPEEIGSKYCPIDPEWSSKVSAIMESL